MGEITIRQPHAAGFFEGRSTKYYGGPRNLAQILERIDLCVAFKKAQQPSVTEFLKSYVARESLRAQGEDQN